MNTTRIYLDSKEYNVVLNLDYKNKKSEINKRMSEQKIQKQNIEEILKNIGWC